MAKYGAWRKTWHGPTAHADGGWRPALKGSGRKGNKPWPSFAWPAWPCHECRLDGPVFGEDWRACYGGGRCGWCNEHERSRAGGAGETPAVERLRICVKRTLEKRFFTSFRMTVAGRAGWWMLVVWRSASECGSTSAAMDRTAVFRRKNAVLPTVILSAYEGSLVWSGFHETPDWLDARARRPRHRFDLSAPAAGNADGALPVILQ